MTELALRARSAAGLRLVRRFSLVAFTASVLAVGVLVGFIVIALFLPLVELLTRLGR